jgi:hypothetical protein
MENSVAAITKANRLGKPIKREDADVLFTRFLEIKAAAVPLIREALAEIDDEELRNQAMRYYCGREGSEARNEDLAYIFDKESLTKILVRILSSKANAFVLFHGARGEEEGSDDKPGRPTLMLFPCMLKEVQTMNRSEYTVTNLLDDGEEHPGTGGSSTGSTRRTPPGQPIPVPEEFETGDIHPLV